MTFIQKLATRFGGGSKAAPDFRYEDFSEIPPDEAVPYLDGSGVDESSLTPDQKAWRRDGVLILRNFIPDEVTAPYIRVREELNRPAGWLHGASYQNVPEMRQLALYPPLMAKLKEVIGEDMMLHLCLTAWITSQREWHQDDYLNPDFVWCWYVAVWIALDDVAPDSGPFEYIAGSHRWPLMRGARVRALLTEEELAGHWPKTAERITTPAVLHEISQRRAKVTQFLGKRGDVVVWHARLMHQGSKPKIRGLERRALIAHYSGVNHRPDIHEDYRARDANGQTYVAFGGEIATASHAVGAVDVVGIREATGWIHDAIYPSRKLEVEAVLDGEVLARGLAGNAYTGSQTATFKSRDHGFVLTLPRELNEEERVRLVVRAALDGKEIARAPGV